MLLHVFANSYFIIQHGPTHLLREGSSSYSVLRGHIQHEAIQLGVSMQHLGAIFLELGHTIITLCMVQSPV